MEWGCLMLWGWVSYLCLFLHPSLVTQTVAVEQIFMTFSEFWAQSPNTNTKRGGFHDVSCFCSDFCSGRWFHQWHLHRTVERLNDYSAQDLERVWGAQLGIWLGYHRQYGDMLMGIYIYICTLCEMFVYVLHIIQHHCNYKNYMAVYC